jgi:hypothetical protein
MWTQTAPCSSSNVVMSGEKQFAADRGDGDG